MKPKLCLGSGVRRGLWLSTSCGFSILSSIEGHNKVILKVRFPVQKKIFMKSVHRNIIYKGIKMIKETSKRTNLNTRKLLHS